VGLLVGGALGLLIFFGLPGAEGGAMPMEEMAPEPVATLAIAPDVGALAPDFRLRSVEGRSVHLVDYRGQVVLLNFWATWCGPCRIEMPAIQDRYERYREQGLVVLAVNFDEPAQQVAAFRDDLGLTFPILLDPGARVQDLYRNRGYPTFFVDRGGVPKCYNVPCPPSEAADGVPAH
jgi:peroxiredoxin